MSDSPLNRGDSQAYIEALLAYLGDRNPLDAFAATPAALRQAVAGLDDAALRTLEAPGKWSVIEVVKHLADVEIVLGFRYRKTAGEPGTPIPAIDQDLWTQELNYSAADLEATLEDFEAVRAVNLRFLRGLPESYLQRYCLHSQRGEETLGTMMRLYAAHDCYHLEQIARIRKAIGA
ncbi:MAG: DUF664 domain-containing protein [Candidatus Hydrogenedens sp.]|nr:DUF664 domain-containing protein [Candidatus Hydrogenedens sp.]